MVKMKQVDILIGLVFLLSCYMLLMYYTKTYRKSVARIEKFTQNQIKLTNTKNKIIGNCPDGKNCTVQIYGNADNTLTPNNIKTYFEKYVNKNNGGYIKLNSWCLSDINKKLNVNQFCTVKLAGINTETLPITVNTSSSSSTATPTATTTTVTTTTTTTISSISSIS